MRAALRKHADPEPFVLGELSIYYEQRRVTVGEREVTLTATEYELLHVLSRNAGRLVTYDALLHQIWRGRRAGDMNLVRNFVKKLRAKLGEDASAPKWILNVARGRLPHADTGAARPPKRVPYS